MTDFTFSSIASSPEQLSVSFKRFGVPSWLPAMNELEAIAAAFVAGVADEETGFKIIGLTFCNSVRQNYDIISFSRDEDVPGGYWHNVVTLYRVWSPRLKQLGLLQQKERLERRIAAAAAGTSSIPPIGVE